MSQRTPASSTDFALAPIASPTLMLAWEKTSPLTARALGPLAQEHLAAFRTNHTTVSCAVLCDIVNKVEPMGALLAEEGPTLQLGYGSEIWSSGLASLDTLLGDAIM